jgi:hypothetical protein
MTTAEVANKLVHLCQSYQFHEAIQSLYAPDVVSVEAAEGPGGPRELKGLDKVLAKSQWWAENHEVHGGTTEGPLVSGTHFAVRFTFDVTRKADGVRMHLDELAVYEVANGKIVREEFFYSMG